MTSEADTGKTWSSIRRMDDAGAGSSTGEGREQWVGMVHGFTGLMDQFVVVGHQGHNPSCHFWRQDKRGLTIASQDPQKRLVIGDKHKRTALQIVIKSFDPSHGC